MPTDIFNELVVEAKKGPLTIWLFDTGRLQLHRADCIGIHWNHDLTRHSTPDPDRTPDYYKNVQYLAWFKLKVIEENAADARLLHGFSYVQVDSFFSEMKSRFQPFYGKQVSSLQELKEQERTIWFLRDFDHAHDSTVEISLLDSARIQQKDLQPRLNNSTNIEFRLPTPQNFIRTGSKQILWLSDLHFSSGKHHRFESKTTLAGRPDLAAALERQLKDSASIGAVLITGDLTWEGKSEEYDLVEQFLRSMATWLGFTNQPERFIFCPGNHDLIFQEDPLAGGEAVPAFKEAKANYAKFFKRWYGRDPNNYLYDFRHLLLCNAVPIDIIALNSSLLQQIKGTFQGQGFLGFDQLDQASHDLEWISSNDESPKAFRIAMVHHHLVPVTHREIPNIGYRPSLVHDAEALSEWIARNDVRLVLHGHMHNPFCTSMSRPKSIGYIKDQWHTFHIFGMGSTGVSLDHVGEVGQNTYGIITFKKNILDISVEKLSPDKTFDENERILWSHSIQL